MHACPSNCTSYEAVPCKSLTSTEYDASNQLYQLYQVGSDTTVLQTGLQLSHACASPITTLHGRVWQERSQQHDHLNHLKWPCMEASIPCSMPVKGASAVAMSHAIHSTGLEPCPAW